MGGPKEISYIHSIQRKIQFDEPANIQFTSVYGNSIFLISTSSITFNFLGYNRESERRYSNSSQYC